MGACLRMSLNTGITLMVLFIMIVSLCQGYTVFNITSTENPAGELIFCNSSWHYRKQITQISVLDKAAQPDEDNCYCRIYHPYNESRMNNLILFIENGIRENNILIYKTWKIIYKESWWHETHKVPTFNIQAGERTNGQNSFFITTSDNNMESTYLPVNITFRMNEETISYTELLHLSCIPHGYLVPETSVSAIAPTTISKTTPYPYTISPEPDSNSTNTNITKPPTNITPGKVSDDTENDNPTIVIIIAVLGTVGAVMLLLLLIIVIYIGCKKRKTKKTSSDNEGYYSGNSDCWVMESSQESIGVGYDRKYKYTKNKDRKYENTKPISTNINGIYNNTAIDIDNSYSNAATEQSKNTTITYSNSDGQQYSRTIPTNSQVERHVHYAEIEASSLSNNHRPREVFQTDNTYAEIDFPASGRNVNNDIQEKVDQSVNPVYATPIKKSMKK